MNVSFYVIYVIVVLAALLPIIFRRVYWLRLVCVVLLALLALVHYTFLLTEQRLVMERGIEQFGASPAKPLPDDFMVAVRIVHDLSQGERPFLLLLIVAFTVLAVLPFGRSAKREDKP
jgi:hypothetical protein